MACRFSSAGLIRPPYYEEVKGRNYPTWQKIPSIRRSGGYIWGFTENVPFKADGQVLFYTLGIFRDYTLGRGDTFSVNTYTNPNNAMGKMLLTLGDGVMSNP